MGDSLSLPKELPFRSKQLLEFIRTLPCSGCNRPATSELDVVAAHQKLKKSGTGTKPPDTQAVPLCMTCHGLEHQGDKTFWKGRNREMAIIKTLTRYIEHLEAKCLEKGP